MSNLPMATLNPSVLPPGSTALERALDQALPAWDGLAEAITPRGPGLLDADPPAFHPWLAAEWGLAEFARDFDSLADLLQAGQPWLLERGSAAAVRRVMGWLGFDQVAIEEDGPYLHIDLGGAASPAELRNIARLVRSSIPAHIRFYRVFHGYDLRPITCDGGQPLDMGLLDNDSGVWASTDTGLDLKASFAALQIRQATAWPQGQIEATATHLHALTLPRADRVELDSWRLDSYVVVDAYSGVGAMFTGTCNAPTTGAPECARGTYDLVCVAWQPQDVHGQRTDSHAMALASPVPTPRRWTGPWDAQPWRPVINTHHTQD
jgi:hypothetical protein